MGDADIFCEEMRFKAREQNCGKSSVILSISVESIQIRGEGE